MFVSLFSISWLELSAGFLTLPWDEQAAFRAQQGAAPYCNPFLAPGQRKMRPTEATSGTPKQERSSDPSLQQKQDNLTLSILYLPKIGRRIDSVINGGRTNSELSDCRKLG
jgi:hypothetical protein